MIVLPTHRLEGTPAMLHVRHRPDVCSSLSGAASVVTLHDLQSSVLALNADDLVSALALARHVTSPSSSEASGSRHDDPSLSARAVHSVKRLHISRANGSVQTAAEMRRRCSVLLRPWLWLRSGCECRCWRPVRREMLAPMPPRPPVVKFACRSVSQ